MSLTRTFLTTLTASVLAAAASADIVAVRFKEPKVANRFKEHLVSRGGEMVLAGEQYVVEGGVALSTGGMPAAQTFDVIVGNSADPTEVPYKIEIDKEGKQKLVLGKKKLVSVAQDDIAGVVLLLKDGTLATLAADYVDRKREVDGLFAARDVLKRDDAQWSEYHQQGVLALERMESWLRSMLYPAAADKLEKELVKQRKLAVVETAETRRAAAVASVAKGEVPDSLIEAAKEISGGSDKFSLQESQHCRIIYREGISDARVASLLQLAEEIISGFRVEFVDPYEDENFKDTLLDHQFAEWIFGYDDETKLDKYWSEYLGFNWDSHKEERLKMAGHPFRRASEPEYGHLWKIDEKANLEGIIAHNLGHALANQHFAKRNGASNQDWIAEGLALFLSLEWLGGNTVTCKAFHDPIKDDYGKVKNEKKAGEVTVELGLRDYYNALAVERGPRVDKLALKTIYQFEDADLAKSWSFMDWIAKKGGRRGQLFLRQCCEFSSKPPTFINDWRKKAEELYEVQGKDVFALVEEQWKSFALVGQETGDTHRK